MNDLKFSQLTDYDVELIKSMANNRLVERKGWNPSKCLIEVVFDYIQARGMNVVKDSSREPTITGPLKSWYEPTKITNRNW